MKKIKLVSIDDVTNFCHVASNVIGDVTVKTDKYIVNGKSIMGVLSLDLSNPICVEVKGKTVEDEEIFWDTLTLMGIKCK